MAAKAQRASQAVATVATMPHAAQATPNAAPAAQHAAPADTHVAPTAPEAEPTGDLRDWRFWHPGRKRGKGSKKKHNKARMSKLRALDATSGGRPVAHQKDQRRQHPLTKMAKATAQARLGK